MEEKEEKKVENPLEDTNPENSNSENEASSKNTELEDELTKSSEEDSFDAIDIDLPFDEKEDKKDEPKKDDELWDPTTELEDVSLFEEFADEIAEIEKAEKEKAFKKTEKIADNNLLFESEVEDVKETLQETDTSQAISQEKEEKSLLPIIISIISTILLFAGVFTIWNLISNTTQNKIHKEKQVTSQAVETKKDQKEHKSIEHQGDAKSEKELNKPSQPELTAKSNEQTPNLPHFEPLSLSSFIIPATQNGQLVFLNIQITLELQDSQMKKQFLMRETRLRDTIYRELKGVDISKGIDDNTLLMLRKPLIDKINQEYSPLKVEDIKLSGYILK